MDLDGQVLILFFPELGPSHLHVVEIGARELFQGQIVEILILFFYCLIVLPGAFLGGRNPALGGNYRINADGEGLRKNFLLQQGLLAEDGRNRLGAGNGCRFLKAVTDF